MCTLSLFKTSNGFRIFMNRDERHDRTDELAPRLINEKNHVFGPLDPDSNGTWIAYNKNGYWGCLLNGYFENENPDVDSSTYTSRGKILPHLLSEKDPINASINFNAQNYMSFRLLVGSSNKYVLTQWDGKTYARTEFHANYEDRAFLLSSSSWQQDNVIKIRANIFTQWLQNRELPPNTVPEFHYCKDPNPQSAPLMSRSYSGTKSITSLNVTANNIKMEYHKIDNDQADLYFKEYGQIHE